MSDLYRRQVSFAAIILILITLFFVFKPIVASAKVLLLVTQEFPQFQFKPLHSITPKPNVEKVEFGDQKIIGDLFIPRAEFDAAKKRNKKPGIIVAMGVKAWDKDKKIILNFSDTLARLGYVVLWPRLEQLDKNVIRLEEPQTFIDAFHYLEKRKEIDENRISYVGFSVGSSLSLIAAQNKEINAKVRSIVFFGGYFNINDYLSALSTKTVIVNGQRINWKPDDSAINHARDLLEKAGLTLKQFSEEQTLSNDLPKKLLRFSPDQNINSLKAKIFILHEKSDTFVPYTESIKLKDALEVRKAPVDYHQANLFEHVQPKKPLSYETGKETLGLFGFLHKIFMYL